MARILITGSADGLGLNAARELIAQGHEVVLHTRSAARARDIGSTAERALAVVTGDLSRLDETRALARKVNELGRMDAVIHNAGIFDRSREENDEGQLRMLAVNVLAPYVLTADLDRPARLIFISSSMHRGHDARKAQDDMAWRERRWAGSEAYGESKLLVTTLAMALAVRWPDTIVHAVDPGWVPTKMGGSSASDDLDAGHQTQAWLAVSDDEQAMGSGGYWFHRRRQQPSSEVNDEAFQQALLERLRAISGVELTALPAD
ncbi:SDR family NAD(P)-dependent oxidoreductase [Salinicola avicenniae]|uniref:SDR family NAD(P)-dependent oxidoreductase n=1 Tax=Salinicola avicenniae TaxID=2916836 RepID=UPI0020735E50|nr:MULTISPECIES: SDR family NAD(P)-dependent oxidoreductase [unclassified Salinicola]